MKNNNKENQKGKSIGIIVGMIFFAIAYFGVQQIFFKKPIEEQMKISAIELNKQTPIEVDQFSRLDSATTKGKTNFIYHYTLKDITKSEVNLDTVNKYIRPNIIQNVKNSPEMKVFRKNRITLDYKYYDKNGEFVTEISVTPKIYLEK